MCMHIFQRRDCNFVNGVERLHVVARGEHRHGKHPVEINALDGPGLVHGKLVRGEGSGLIRAEDINTSE